LNVDYEKGDDMKRPEELTGWDFGDTIQVPDGYDMKSIPDLTRHNFQTLIDEHNNLVEAFNAMAEFNGFDQFVDYGE